jgi:hypothetical protein
MNHRVMQLCKARHTYWSEVFEGTRSQCKTWVAGMARHGRHTCSMYITSRSIDDWWRLNPL